MSDDTPRPNYDSATGRKILGYDPFTGRPVLEPVPERPRKPKRGLWEQWRGLARWQQLVVGGGALLLAVLIVAGTGGGSSGPQLTGVVHGDMVGAGNIGAGNALVWSHVYCGWEGDHVEIHADLTNGLPAASDPVQQVSNAETVTISPIYTIRWSDGSEHRHGDGIYSIIDGINVPASKTISWWGNAGSPEGIKQDAPIGSCVPEVMDVEH